MFACRGICEHSEFSRWENFDGVFGRETEKQKELFSRHAGAEPWYGDLILNLKIARFMFFFQVCPAKIKAKRKKRGERRAEDELGTEGARRLGRA